MHPTGSAAIVIVLLASATLTTFGPASAQAADTQTVKDIMTQQVVPASDTIWGASELATDAEWKPVGDAARVLVKAGESLSGGGASEVEQAWIAQPEWQAFNQQMIDAARQILIAVEQRDEEALFNIGNDALYPPCAGCHERYMPK
ncbi:hypothetical protein [Elongatibacter sediminis]|uniref:Cytochrome c n=1 Tax=Elongatibacter sediminis TaxID=3119006 RepID=A0AAW9RC49_9GAMM